MTFDFKRTFGSLRAAFLATLLLATAVGSAQALTGTLVVRGPNGGGNTYPNPPFPGCNSPTTNGGWLTVDSPGYPAPLMGSFVVGPTGTPPGPPIGTGSFMGSITGGGGAAQALLFTSFGGTPLSLLAAILGPGTGYGLGVAVLMNPAQKGNVGSVGEFGWSGAASTHVLIDPKEDLVAIYCTQLMGGDFNLRAEFASLLYQSIIGG